MKQRTLLIITLLLFAGKLSFSQSSYFSLGWQSHYPGYVSPLTLQVDNTGKPYLYAASNEYGLKIYNLNGTVANTVDTNALSMPVMSFTQYGNLLYVVIGSHFVYDPPGLVILDISNPLAPVVKDTWIHARDSNCRGAGIVKVEGNYAYLGGMGNGLIILDVADPTNIIYKSELMFDINYPFPGPANPKFYNARGMEVRNSIVYLCFDAGGLRIVNCVNPLAPVETGRYANPITYSSGDHNRAYNNIVLNDTIAYVTVDYCGLEVLDISDTANITLMDNFNPHNAPTGTWWTSPLHTNEMIYNAGCKELFMSTGKSEMIAMDVSNPYAIDSIGGYGSLTDTTGTWGIGMRNDSIFLSYMWVPWCLPFVCPFDTKWNGIKMIKWLNPCAAAGIEESDKLIVSINSQPNPFSSNTEIHFTLRDELNAQIKVFDMMGRTIKVFDKQKFLPGENFISWNGTDASGNEAAEGMYFVRIQTENEALTAKIFKIR